MSLQPWIAYPSAPHWLIPIPCPQPWPVSTSVLALSLETVVTLGPELVWFSVAHAPQPGTRG